MAYIFQRSLHASTKIMKHYSKLPNSFRTLTTSKCLAENYEGDGKTTVTMLNREYKNVIMIDSYSQLGFRLNNGIFVMGPLAAFPRTVLQWNINSVEEITPESLSLFCLLEPKLDIFVLGTGDDRKLPCKDALDYLKANRISAEILPTDQACIVFNFLNIEGRCIAGAFIPPEDIIVYGEEKKLLDEVKNMDDYTTIKYDKIIK